MYLVRGLVFQPLATMGKITLKKKIFSSLLYESWEVLSFENNRNVPFIAHIFKYSLSSNFPLDRKEVDLWCMKIYEMNSQLKQRLLDIRLNPCHENKSNVYITTENSEITYVLFPKPDGGLKLEETCQSSCSKDRICRYSLKNVSRALLRFYSISNSTYEKSDVRMQLVKGAFYFGKLPKPNISTKTESTYAPLVDLIRRFSFLNKDQEDTKHYYIVIPFFKFSTADGLKNFRKPEQEIRQALEKIDLYYIGKFLERMYIGLNESEDLPPFELGDNFSVDPKDDGKDLVDLFYKLNEADVKDKDINVEPYFGIKQEFVDAVKENYNKETYNDVKQYQSLLEGTFYEFIRKLVDYNGDQFNTYKDALGHKFLNGKVFIRSIQSDTADN